MNVKKVIFATILSTLQLATCQATFEAVVPNKELSQSGRATIYDNIVEGLVAAPKEYRLTATIKYISDAEALKTKLQAAFDDHRLDPDQIKSLSLTGMQDKEFFNILKPIFKKLPIQELRLYRENDLNQYAKFTSKWKNLSIVRADHSDFKDNEIEKFLNSLMGHKNIRYIDLESNALSTKLIPTIQGLIITCPKLCALQMRAQAGNCNLGVSGLDWGGSPAIHKFIEENRRYLAGGTCRVRKPHNVTSFKVGGYVFTPRDDKAEYNSAWEVEKKYSVWMEKPLSELLAFKE